MFNRDDYPYFESVDVRWGDMDAMGHVNNAVYFSYLESARIHFFEVMGLLALIGEDGCGIGLVSANCNFRREVRYPATLEIGTRVKRIGNSSFTLHHVFFDKESGEAMADGESVVVWVNYGLGKSQPLPESLLAKLEKTLQD